VVFPNHVFTELNIEHRSAGRDWASDLGRIVRGLLANSISNWRFGNRRRFLGSKRSRRRRFPLHHAPWRSEPSCHRCNSDFAVGDSTELFSAGAMEKPRWFLFALPLLVTGLSTKPWGWLDFAAVLIWVISIVGEAISDQQLHRFRQQPENKGEVCRDGFWNYSRHPNYFFEWLHWWTYVLLAITAPFGWLTILAPVAMWLFLNRVTGIPHTEAQAIKSRGQKYRHYQETTNAFFPWFPKQTIPATAELTGNSND